MAKREPYPPKPKATPMGKIMGAARGMKVDPMRYIGPAKPPVKGQMPKRGSMDNDLRSMGPRKLPAKTMPKQMGPKKPMKPKQMKMKRMGY